MSCIAFCFLRYWHTPEALVWDDDSRTGWWLQKILCARTHAPKQSVERASPRELSHTTAIKSLYAEPDRKKRGKSGGTVTASHMTPKEVSDTWNRCLQFGRLLSSVYENRMRIRGKVILLSSWLRLPTIKCHFLPQMQTLSSMAALPLFTRFPSVCAEAWLILYHRPYDPLWGRVVRRQEVRWRASHGHHCSPCRLSCSARCSSRQPAGAHLIAAARHHHHHHQRHPRWRREAEVVSQRRRTG